MYNSMPLEEVKKIISSRTNIPITLLTGESIEENVAIARALIAYAGEQAPEKRKPTNVQFAEWLASAQGIEKRDVLSDIEDGLRAPENERQTTEPKSAREQFRDQFIGVIKP